MCKAGDIIIINNYNHNGETMKKHSFVVVDDESGEIQGLDYDFVANVMSSFKNEKQKAQKLKYPGNFPVEVNDTITNPDNGKEGFIKSEQFYYFNKAKIDFMVIGQMTKKKFEELIEFINNLETDIEEIIDNLEK
ncbi:hypothetical protein N2W29_003107 [Clostridium perfringens]|uniref:hypothetical protein n=1 Tax=Clostridium perfringens TaxID=1502 RepID=UPI003BACD559|nr:hypothetical protein [Clostridium perfringens]